MTDANVESLTRLCNSLDGSGTPPSVRDAVLRSTGIELPSFEDEGKALAVLVILFKGILENSFNGEVMLLAMYKTVDLFHGIMEEEEVVDYVHKLVKAAKRRPQLLDKLF